MKLTPEEAKSIEEDDDARRRKSLHALGGYGAHGVKSEEDNTDLQKLLSKYVRFLHGVNKGRLGFVSSISIAGVCNVLLLQPKDMPRAHTCARSHRLDEVADFNTLADEEKGFIQAHKDHREKKVASATVTKISREARMKERGISDGIDDDEEKDTNEETEIKSPKITRKETSLVGNYVRVGSGAFTGRLGRAVSNTIGNIYSISILDLPSEKTGLHTSVTASRLTDIKEGDCTDLELSAIENDKALLKKRLEKKNLLMQRYTMEKKLPKNSTDRTLNREGPVSDSDDQAPKCSLHEVPKDAMDKYLRLKTGQYTGLLARVTSLVGKHRCSVKILEEPGCSTFKGTTVTGANFVLADIESLGDAEKAIYENDLKIREAGGPNSSSGGREKVPKMVFTVNITGQYIRLLSGLYGGKIGRITHCPVGSTPCNVKVQSSCSIFLI